MRLAAGVSLLMSIAAFILGFLCLYAGSKPGVLETPTYSIISLNTSRISENILQKVQDTYRNDKTKLLSILNSLLQEAFDLAKNSTGIGNRRRDVDEVFVPFNLEDIITARDLPHLTERELNDLQARGIIDSITSSIENAFGDVKGAFKALTDPKAAFEKAEQIVRQLAEKIGLQDFYSYHVKDYCEGQYTPSEIPNATLPLSQIQRNVTECKQYLHWKPSDPVQKLLNKTGLARAGVTLDTIHWPKELDDKVLKAESLLNATMWLYVVTIIFAGLAALAALIILVRPGSRHVLMGTVLSILAFLGFLVVLIASAATTAAAVQVDKIFKKYGDAVGVAATKGTGYLGLTWACTAALFIAGVVGAFTCCGGRKKKTTEKYG